LRGGGWRGGVLFISPFIPPSCFPQGQLQDLNWGQAGGGGGGILRNG
jgi:hypothetical protein